MLIKWQDDLSTGIAELDQEHQDLLRHVNALYRMLANGLERPAIERALDELRSHVKKHFASEEAYLERTGSRRLEDHRHMHLTLLEDFEQIIADSRRDGFHFIREDMEAEIAPWLVQHIVNFDKKLPQ